MVPYTVAKSACLQKGSKKPSKALIFDPVEQPFAALTFDEERRLVRPINPFMQLCVLPSAQRQMACMGNTINFLNESR